AAATQSMPTAAATQSMPTAWPACTQSADRADLLQIKTRGRACSIYIRWRACPLVVGMHNIGGVAAEVDVRTGRRRPEEVGCRRKLDVGQCLFTWSQGCAVTMRCP